MPGLRLKGEWRDLNYADFTRQPAQTCEHAVIHPEFDCRHFRKVFREHDCVAVTSMHTPHVGCAA